MSGAHAFPDHPFAYQLKIWRRQIGFHGLVYLNYFMNGAID